MDLKLRLDQDDDARPVLLLHGGSPSARQVLMRQLNSMGNGFRLVEFSTDDRSPHSDEDDIDGCDVLAFLMEFSDRLLSVTKKDREVLYYVLAGKTNKAIAIQLDLSERTIELRKASLMKKLNASSHTDLVRRITKFDTLMRYIAYRTHGAPLQSKSMDTRLPTAPMLNPISDSR